MPFTIGGDWKSNDSTPDKNNKQPIKVRNIKRKKALLTVIYNIGTHDVNMTDIAQTLKRRLGVGGAIKNQDIELQGHKANEVKSILQEMGLKAQ